MITDRQITWMLAVFITICLAGVAVIAWSARAAH